MIPVESNFHLLHLFISIILLFIEFSTKSTLEKHIISEIKNITFFCENCPKVYKYKHDLKTHEKIHSSSNVQFICSDDGCEEVFSYKRNLKAHMKIHTDKNQNNSNTIIISILPVDKSPFGVH